MEQKEIVDFFKTSAMNKVGLLKEMLSHRQDIEDIDFIVEEVRELAHEFASKMYESFVFYAEEQAHAQTEADYWPFECVKNDARWSAWLGILKTFPQLPLNEENKLFFEIQHIMDGETVPNQKYKLDERREEKRREEKKNLRCRMMFLQTN